MLAAPVPLSIRPISGCRALRRWLVSIAATGVSTYALDAIATFAGLALVASGIMRDIELSLAWALLGASYVVWWVGLRVSLAANWALLETTGTSTNILSKVGYAWAHAWSASVRARRLAASVGYVGAELAKEAPYYLGAFGVAVVSDFSVSPRGADLSRWRQSGCRRLRVRARSRRLRGARHWACAGPRELRDGLAAQDLSR